MRLRITRLLLWSLACALLSLGFLFVRYHRSGVVHELVSGGAVHHGPVVAAVAVVEEAPAARPTTTLPSIAAAPTAAAQAVWSADRRRIPYILHQTWISDSIPSTYVPFVKSWLGHQPPLDYYYWTDAKSVEFVAKHYPHLLSMFTGYKAHLNRADAIRYMLLHHYGGIYADMDMLRLKDLSPLLNSSQELCYLSQERYEITRLYWGLNSSVMNAIMLASPGHKFMEYVVNALPRYAHHSPNVMESTGPFFLQNVYNAFTKAPPCNLSDAACRCLAADPYVFMPQIDPIRIPMFHQKCAASASLASNAREACGMLDRIHWQNEVSQIGAGSYTHHGFLHYGFENQRLRFASMADIGGIHKDKLTFGVHFH